MSDSTTALTIGDESFVVLERRAIPPAEEKCLADETHQLFEVVTEDAGTFVVCDECSSSRRIPDEPAPVSEPLES